MAKTNAPTPATGSASAALSTIPALIVTGAVTATAASALRGLAPGSEDLTKEVAKVMGAVAGALVTAFLVQRSFQRDTAQSSKVEDLTDPQDPTTSRTVLPAVPPIVLSPTTRTLIVLLAAFCFWILGWIVSLVAYGTLFLSSGDLLDRYLQPDAATWSDDAFRMAAPRAWLLFFVGAVPIALAAAHRLRERALQGLVIAALVYGLGNLVIRIGLLDWRFVALDAAWLLGDVGTILVASWLGVALARRSQHRFDIVQAARVGLRDT